MDRSRRFEAIGLAALLALATLLAIAACQTKPATAPADKTMPITGGEAQMGESPPATAAGEAAASSEAAAFSEATVAMAPAIEPSAIDPATEGFWPAPESRSRSIAISVLIGNGKLLRSWKVAIAPDRGSGAAVKTYAGNAGDRPETLTWDGLGPGGALAREGLYAATLTADYDGNLPSLSLKSRSFALSLAPPEPALYADPSRLELGPEGIKKSVTFDLSARAALARLDSWRLDIVGPDGRLFRAFEGAWPAIGTPAPLSWDGRSDSGAAVEAGKRYAAILSVRDIYGHSGAAQAGIAVADLPDAPERSSVQPWSNGFSPNGDKVMDTMDFSLGFGQRAAIRSWRLEISRADKSIVRVFRGAAPDLPSSLSWDGKDDSGTAAPEGRYSAILNIDYGSTFSPGVARSPFFVLDVTPPAMRLASSPDLFAPDGSPSPSGGNGSTLSISLDASSPLARMTDWSVEILDPGDHVFARFDGSWPPKTIAWNGLGADGSLVESAETYRIVAGVRDEFGNSNRAEREVETDILVIKEDNRYRVAVASIVFKGYTDDYQDLPAEQANQNRQTLDRLAAKFAKFPGYRIRLVGHAVMINWDDPNLGKPEQEKILVPLSRSRAAAIAEALASRGIAESRMIVEGVGATKPLVPDSDLVNRWKNRRVEFFLEK